MQFILTMAEDQSRKVKFLAHFQQVCCLRCLQRLSSHQRLFVLKCSHIFCGKCIQKVCKLRDQNRRIWKCGVCTKEQQLAQFSEKLPIEFLRRFVPVNCNNFFRTVQFRIEHKKRATLLMRRRLFGYQEAVRRIYQQKYGGRCKTSEHLNSKYEYFYKKMCTVFRKHDIDLLLSHSIRQLLGLRFKRGSPNSPRFVCERIDELSSASLLRQVLLKNASSSPSTNSRSQSGSY